MSETKTMNVVVHKAIELRSGETLHDFTRALSSAGREHTLKKLSIVKNQGGAWMVETFKDSVVYSAYKNSEDKDKLFAFSFKRDAAGTFEFGALLEVERVSGFRPKPASVSITKSATPAKTVTATDGGGWKPVRKNTGDTFVDRLSP